MLKKSDLAYFTGTERYTHGPLRRFVMTDGVTHLCDHGCSWLVDLIASHQTKALQDKSEGFQEWHLQQTSNAEAVVECRDGNLDTLLSQSIEYTDFPFDEFPNGIKIWLQHGSIDGRNMVWVAMLPSEH